MEWPREFSQQRNLIIRKIVHFDLEIDVDKYFEFYASWPGDYLKWSNYSLRDWAASILPSSSATLCFLASERNDGITRQITLPTSKCLVNTWARGPHSQPPLEMIIVFHKDILFPIEYILNDDSILIASKGAESIVLLDPRKATSTDCFVLKSI